AGLRQRFGLTDAVPCRGTELQPRCQLLAEAREAQIMLPSADAEVARIRITLDEINSEMRRLETTLNELGDTGNGVRAAHAALQAAQVRLQDCDAAYVRVTREDASLRADLASARGRSAELAKARIEVTRIESELGWWGLLSKALGNDGVIALCVDDAGPDLARLTNDLLLACYGPRFTVSIHTRVETVKKK